MTDDEYDMLLAELKALPSWEKEGKRKVLFFGVASYCYSTFYHGSKKILTFLMPIFNTTNEHFYPSKFNTILVNKYEDAHSTLGLAR